MVQQGLIGGLHFGDELGQLPDAVIGLGHGQNAGDGAEDLLGVRIGGEVVPFPADPVHLLDRLVKDGALALEEQLHTLHVLGGVQQIVLLLHHAVQ